MSFAAFWVILFYPLPWFIAKYYPPYQKNTGDALFYPFYKRIKRLMEKKEVAKKTSRTNPFFIVIWSLLVLAGMRPIWIGKSDPVPEASRQMILAVDISASMQTPDMEIEDEPADRLSTVKMLANAFIEKRQGDQMGLILFGSKAYLQSPITFDLKTIQSLLNDASIGLAGTQTAIGDAIGLAIKHLSPLSEGPRVLILLTDGASNAGILDPKEAALLAAKNHLKIYTIGIGSDAFLMPGLLGPQMINPSADLDEKMLQMIAKTTGGEYFRSKDSKTLEKIYKAINRLEPQWKTVEAIQNQKEMYIWPLLIAFLCVIYQALYYLYQNKRPTLSEQGDKA